VPKTAFDKIKAGLDDVKAYLEGSADKSGYRIHVPNRLARPSVKPH
jgi:fibronectin type 3 domain-containing protein